MKFVDVPIEDDVARIEVPNHIRYIAFKKWLPLSGKGPKSGRAGMHHWFTDKNNETWVLVQLATQQCARWERDNGYDIARVDGGRVPWE